MATAKKSNRNLVSMTFRRPWGRYAKGDRAGFEPERAKELEDRKIAVRSAKAKEADKEGGTQATGGQKTAETKGTEGADKT